MQVPRGLLGDGAGEPAQVGLAVVILGLVQLPAGGAGADRGQREHERDQRRKRPASLPLLGVVGLDGLVAFRHPINVAIACAARSSDEEGAKGSLSAAIVDNSFTRPNSARDINGQHS